MTVIGSGGGRRILLLGATGTIGRAVAETLVAEGYDVVCPLRARNPDGSPRTVSEAQGSLPGTEVRLCDLGDPASLARDGFGDDAYDGVLSCIASRGGAPKEAWAIDYGVNHEALRIAERRGIGHFVLLSAICVQKPKLAFQNAKLAFETELMASPVTGSVVRPTAYFKSLSGQIDRVRQGKPFLLFGDGRATACKPISDRDTARYLVRCLTDDTLQGRILPIGGPGPAITLREQGEELFRLTGREPKFQSVPPGLFQAIAGTLSALGTVIPPLKDKAEFARIAHYYATESMLVLDPESGAYSAEATPSFGSDRLFDYYARVLAGDDAVERGAHTVFERQAS